MILNIRIVIRRGAAMLGPQAETAVGRPWVGKKRRWAECRELCYLCGEGVVAASVVGVRGC